MIHLSELKVNFWPGRPAATGVDLALVDPVTAIRYLTVRSISVF